MNRDRSEGEFQKAGSPGRVTETVEWVIRSLAERCHP